jgi:hypothetical protein
MAKLQRLCLGGRTTKGRALNKRDVLFLREMPLKYLWLQGNNSHSFGNYHHDNKSRYCWDLSLEEEKSLFQNKSILSQNLIEYVCHVGRANESFVAFPFRMYPEDQQLSYSW